MSLKYESQAAHALLSELDKTNLQLANAGYNVIKAKNAHGWDDAQHNQFIKTLNSILGSVGTAINNQNEYKSLLQNAVNRLEG